MNKEDLVTLTADIVSAHVGNNNVAIGDIATLVERVHSALAGLGAPPAPPPEKPKTSAAAIRASIKPDYLTCLGCGRRQKTLKRHLMTKHNLTPAQYREEYGLPESYPMASPNYAEVRRAMAKTIGLGRKPGAKAAGASSPAASPKAPRKAAGRPSKAAKGRGRPKRAANRP